MPKARQSTGSPTPPLTPMAGRVVRLLHLLWGGKQRQMAADLGVSQAAISRIVRGEQAVGPRMQATIGARRGVNADWLRTGLGEPLLDPAVEAAAGDWLAPVAKVILPGTPADHSGLLTGERLAVANAYRRTTRYVLVVGPDDLVVGVEGAKVAAGDHLLMEADRDLWLNNRRVLVGKLVALRLSGEHGGDFVLARADMHPTTRELSFDCFGVRVAPTSDTGAIGMVDQGAGSRQPEPAAEASGEAECATMPERRRSVQVRRPRPSSGTPAETDAPQPTPATEPVPDVREEGRLALPSINDVVAFCVLLIRT